MDGHKFRSGLTEVNGDGTYKCITMSKISLKPLTSDRPSRAAPSQLKTYLYCSVMFVCHEKYIFSCEEAALDVLTEVSRSKQILLIVMHL